MIELKRIERLEHVLNYIFQDKDNIILALTHSSYANEYKNSRNNERLEFLGDSVLNFTIAETIFKKYPKLPEGEMTKFRANVVCESSLVICANKLGLGDYILLGKGERLSGGKNRTSILSDTFEAVVGAIFIDGGLEKAQKFIQQQMSEIVENSVNGIVFMDYKTKLQEMVQKENDKKIVYQLLSETVPDHNKFFVTQVWVEGKVLGTGKGKTKKQAEQNAARNALEEKNVPKKA
jgi:ribonuclease-3